MRRTRKQTTQTKPADVVIHSTFLNTSSKGMNIGNTAIQESLKDIFDDVTGIITNELRNDKSLR